MSDDIHVRFTESKLAYLYKDGELIYPRKAEKMYVIATTDDTEPAPYIGSRKTTLDVLARLDWKTEPPIKPGWYWVNFQVGSTNFQVIVSYPLDGSESNMNLATHWLGPLPPPELPK